jgi:hypothetical protein
MDGLRHWLGLGLEPKDAVEREVKDLSRIRKRILERNGKISIIPHSGWSLAPEAWLKRLEENYRSSFGVPGSEWLILSYVLSRVLSSVLAPVSKLS